MIRYASFLLYLIVHIIKVSVLQQYELNLGSYSYSRTSIKRPLSRIGFVAAK
jgi:hypothetical protein